MKRRLILAILSCALSIGFLPAQEPAAEGPALMIYPSFHLKFTKGSKNYLLGSFVIVNVSGLEMRNLTLTQKLPEELVPSASPADIHDYLVRPEGFTESLDGTTYKMTVPVLHKRELTAGFVVLRYKGRPDEVDVAPAEVEYTAGGQQQAQKGPPVRLELRKYSRYSGSISDFIKRYASIQMSIPEGTTDWGFSSLASRVRAKTPIGVVEIEGDAAEGRFSLLCGAPGDSREMIVSWRPTARAKPAGTAEEVRKLIGDQIFATAEFTYDTATAGLEKEPFARGEAWFLDTQWKDRADRRLGEGPMRWVVYDDAQKETQYIVMARVQGRGAGPDLADKPNPEKEAALMEEIKQILKSFRPL